MKKSLFFVLWCGVCVCVSAAFQYEVIKGSAADWSNPNAIGGYSFTVKVNESGALYILDKINNVNSQTGNTELLALKADMSAGNYGYVTLDGTKIGGDGSKEVFYQETKPYQQEVTQLGYKLGDFEAGDEVGVWITVKNKTGASILDKTYADINSNQMNYRNANVGTDALGGDLQQLDFKGSGRGTVNFGIGFIAGPAPTGKPLPGVLATLLLGSGALGALGMRKKRISKA